MTVTCAHLVNENGICCEELTATYSTSGAARLVRRGIHVISNVIKILTLGTGPCNVCHCAHVENVDGICYEEVTATWHSSTKR